jgi:precorrin-6B methylase 2
MTFATYQDAIQVVESAMKISDHFLATDGTLPLYWYNSTESGLEVKDKVAQMLHMKGLSSPGCRIFMNTLCGKPGTRYLEVGTYTGSSLIAACYNNPLGRAVAIDNWSMDANAKPKLLSNLNFMKHQIIRKPEIIDGDAFTMDKSQLGEFDVYFYDGHHSADSQEKGITCFWDNLAPISIVVVDDYSIFRVQQGTIRALDKIGCKQHLRYAWTLPGGKGFEDMYWGGLAVMVFEK